MQALVKEEPSSIPAPTAALASSTGGNSKSDSKVATRPSLERRKRVAPGTSRMASGHSRETPSTSKGKGVQHDPVSSNPQATVDLSGFSPSRLPTPGSKQHWLGKAGNILQRWTAPVKVKKEKKDNRDVSKDEVIVID